FDLMTFFNRLSTPAHAIQKAILMVAALGLVFPTVSSAQVQSETTTGSVSRPVLEDGTYLFGQSPEPDTIGSAYAVLSVQNNQAVGAFYYPHSSFDCFSGQVYPDRLAVNVVDSYEQTVHPYEVALTLDDTLVAGAAAGAYTLEGFHQLDDLSAQDVDMLSVCAADFK
ncbi:MAG: hypothetical protein AAFN12_17955, partial [Cyanobacteria bacterium J06560_2]